MGLATLIRSQEPQKKAKGYCWAIEFMKQACCNTPLGTPPPPIGQWQRSCRQTALRDDGDAVREDVGLMQGMLETRMTGLELRAGLNAKTPRPKRVCVVRTYVTFHRVYESQFRGFLWSARKQAPSSKLWVSGWGKTRAASREDFTTLPLHWASSMKCVDKRILGHG